MSRTWWPLAVVCTATFMFLLDVTIVVVALPDIQRSLGAGFDQLQWVTDAYALALASLLLTAGSIADRVGRRRVFAVGLAVFTAASVLCGLAGDPVLLIAARAIQGVGGAMLFATSLALLSVLYQGRARGVAFGAWGAVTGVATALGPILGGVLTTGLSWRWIFLVNLPVGLLALWGTRVITESRAEHPRRVDILGVATLTVGLLAVVFGFIETGSRSWGDPVVVWSFVIGALMLVAFVAVEKTVREPMFDLSLLRTPTFVGGSLAAFAMNGSLFAMLLYVVLYLQDGLGYSSLEAGLRLVLISGATMVVATLSGRLAHTLPARWLIGPGLLLVGVGLALCAGLDGGSSWTHLALGFVVAGVGSGLVNPPLASTAVGVVDHHRSGMASGVNNTCRQVGIAVGIAVYGSLFAARVRSSLESTLAGSSDVRSRAGELADAVHDGAAGRLIGALPADQRAVVADAVRAAFADGMDTLFVVSAAVAVVGGVCALLLVRGRDFVVAQAPDGRTEASDDPVAAG
ncbi:MAG: MFS transporter [Gordonia paraffinivorans]